MWDSEVQQLWLVWATVCSVPDPSCVKQNRRSLRPSRVAAVQLRVAHTHFKCRGVCLRVRGLCGGRFSPCCLYWANHNPLHSPWKELDTIAIIIIININYCYYLDPGFFSPPSTYLLQFLLFIITAVFPLETWPNHLRLSSRVRVSCVWFLFFFVLFFFVVFFLAQTREMLLICNLQAFCVPLYRNRLRKTRC